MNSSNQNADGASNQGSAGSDTGADLYQQIDALIHINQGMQQRINQQQDQPRPAGTDTSVLSEGFEQEQRTTQQQILESIQASLNGNSQRMVDLRSLYRMDQLSNEQINQLAQRRAQEGIQLLGQRNSSRIMDALQSSRENSGSPSGRPLEQRPQRRMRRSGAGPLESDEDDQLLNELEDSRPEDELDDEDEDLGEDAIRSSASSPPLASYNNPNNRPSARLPGRVEEEPDDDDDPPDTSDDDSSHNRIDDDEDESEANSRDVIAESVRFGRELRAEATDRRLRARLNEQSESGSTNAEAYQRRRNFFNRILQGQSIGANSQNPTEIQMPPRSFENNFLGGGDRPQNSHRNIEPRLSAREQPLQVDDIDDNDEVVSMSDSLNMISQSRANQLAQSSAQRRSTNRNSSQITEESKTSASAKLDEMFKCFICFGKIKDAVLCPKCSKFSCKECMVKWLNEQRQQCPHCRVHLSINQLVPGRFFNEIYANFEILSKPVEEEQKSSTMLEDGTIIRDGKEVCRQHGKNIEYYCQTCKVSICPDCAIFGSNKHKDHEILHLKEVYDKHCDFIKKEAQGLKKRLKELQKYSTDVKSTIDKVAKAKEDKMKEIENFVEDIQHKLNTKLKNKLLSLQSQRQSMQDEIEQLESFHKKLGHELTKTPKTSLIKKSGDLIRQLKEIHTKEPHRFVDTEVAVDDFSSDLVPEYESSTFTIKNFSRILLQQNQPGQEENEIVYSDPPLITKSGLTWRLKVYPNGNGIAKGNYISVFLEMLKGLPEGTTQKYDYRVEMLNHRSPSFQVVREFGSDFEVGECWGYNRFYRIDLLQSEGYLNQVDDSITLKFFVRAPNYSQHCLDQQRYIEQMKRQMVTKDLEIQDFKNKQIIRPVLERKTEKVQEQLAAIQPEKNEKLSDGSSQFEEEKQEDNKFNELQESLKNLKNQVGKNERQHDTLGKNYSVSSNEGICKYDDGNGLSEDSENLFGQSPRPIGQQSFVQTSNEGGLLNPDINQEQNQVEEEEKTSLEESNKKKLNFKKIASSSQTSGVLQQIKLHKSIVSTPQQKLKKDNASVQEEQKDSNKESQSGEK